MNLEEAICYLRKGNKIYRSSSPEKGSLCGTLENVYNSFYLTIYDVLAEDWEIKQKEDNKLPEPAKNKEDEFKKLNKRIDSFQSRLIYLEHHHERFLNQLNVLISSEKK